MVAPTFTVRLLEVGCVVLPSLSSAVAVTVFVCDPPQKYASNVHDDVKSALEAARVGGPDGQRLRQRGWGGDAGLTVFVALPVGAKPVGGRVSGVSTVPP